jgi:hypothetical protein
MGLLRCADWPDSRTRTGSRWRIARRRLMQSARYSGLALRPRSSTAMRVQIAVQEYTAIRLVKLAQTKVRCHPRIRRATDDKVILIMNGSGDGRSPCRWRGSSGTCRQQGPDLSVRINRYRRLGGARSDPVGFADLDSVVVSGRRSPLQAPPELRRTRSVHRAGGQP